MSFLLKISLFSLSFFQLCSANAQKRLLTVEISTYDSYLIIGDDTTHVPTPTTIELELESGIHIVQNTKDSYLTKKKIIDLTPSSWRSLSFSPLVKIPMLADSKKIILNRLDFTGIAYTPVKSHSSKLRFSSESDKAKKFNGNLTKKLAPQFQENMIQRFIKEYSLDEDEKKHGFTISENNLNIDFEVTSLLMEEYRSEMERYKFTCKLRLLDLKLNPLDSAHFNCVVENNFGIVSKELLSEKLIENMCVFIENCKWKGLLNMEGTKEKANKKFDLSTIQNVSNYIDARKAVVTIITENGHGSGCLVRKDGLVVTNAHVIKGVETVQAITFFGDTITGRVEDYVVTADLAMIQLEDSVDFIFKITHSSAPIEIGKRVFAIGSPLSPLLSQSISDGIISAELDLNGVNYIQTDAKVNGGNSGGALVDEQGNLLGIVNAKVVDFSVEGISFAIPTSEVLHNFTSYE